MLSAKPLLIDEVISALPGADLRVGPISGCRRRAITEFTSAMHLLDWDGKVYGQFPAGGPAMLAIGTLLHAEWLVGPVATAIGVYLFARLLRRLELRDGTALAALLLYAFAPFTVFLGGSMMNHVTRRRGCSRAALALVDRHGATRRPRARVPRWRWGWRFGVAATIRPTDAAAFAIPGRGRGCSGARGWARRTFKALLLSGVGVAIPMALLLLGQLRSRPGSPLRFGYIEMWGKSHEIGFHAAPWGPAHTPARGLELINLYLLRLQDYFLETAGPSLLFATLALALTRRPRRVRSLGAGRHRGCCCWRTSPTGTTGSTSGRASCCRWRRGWRSGRRACRRCMEERRVAVPVVRGTVVAGVIALLIGAWSPCRSGRGSTATACCRCGSIWMRWPPRAACTTPWCWCARAGAASCWPGCGRWASVARTPNTSIAPMTRADWSC